MANDPPDLQALLEQIRDLPQPPISVRVPGGAVTTSLVWQALKETLAGLVEALANPGPPVGEAGGDLGGEYPSPVVTGIQNRPVSPDEPAASDTLVWSGDQWVPGTPPGGPPSGPAGGDLSGMYPGPAVASVGGVTAADVAAQLPSANEKAALAGTNGAPSGVNRYVTDSDPRNTNGRAPSGAAGGDLAGTYPGPSVGLFNSMRALVAGPGQANRVLRSTGSGGIALGTVSLPRTITVSALGSADYTTVSAALAAAAVLVPPPSASAPVLIVLAPGLYLEAIPLVVPAGVTVAGGGSGTSIVGPGIPGTAVFNLAPGSALSRLGITGLSTPGLAGVLVNSGVGDVFLSFVGVVDCGLGVHVTGAGRRVWATQGSCMLTAPLPGAVGMRVDGGAQANFFAWATTCAPGATLSTGVLATGAGTMLLMADHLASDCDTGLYADDDASVEVMVGRYRGLGTGIHVGPAGAVGTVVDFRGLKIEDSTVLDIRVESVLAVLRYLGSSFLNARTSIPIGVNTVGLHLENLPGSDAGINVAGEFVVGRYDEGADSIFGEGDDHVVGMSVLSNSNGEAGAWVDNTTDASTGVTYALLQGTGINQSAYFGGQVPFPHIDVNVQTAQVTGGGGAVTWEYWNGASWVFLPVMASDAEQPVQYAQEAFTRVAHEHVRFGSTTGWATRSLNGITAYWVRYRVTAPISTAPAGGLTKLGTSHAAFGEQGAPEYFGEAEPERQVLTSRQIQYSVAGSVPASLNVAYSPNITLVYTNNRLADGAVDAFGFVLPVPVGLDTSKRLRLSIVWMQDNNSAAGNVEFIVRYAQSPDGAIVNGALAETEVTAVVAAPAQQFRQVRTEIDLLVPTLLPGELFVFTITRDATAGNPDDTLAGNISILNFSMTGIFWR